jgi:hypothetical protein
MHDTCAWLTYEKSEPAVLSSADDCCDTLHPKPRHLPQMVVYWSGCS